MDNSFTLTELDERTKIKLCVLFTGLPEAGKTYSSLFLATELLNLEKEGKFTIFLDTENSLQYYQDTFKGKYRQVKLKVDESAETKPGDPEPIINFLQALLNKIKQKNPDMSKVGALIIDSISDLWVQSLADISEAEVRGSYGFNSQREHGKINIKLHELKTLISELRSYIHVFLTCKLKASASGVDARTKQDNVLKITNINELADFANVKKDFFYIPPIIALALQLTGKQHKVRILANKTDSFLQPKELYVVDKSFAKKLFDYTEGVESAKAPPTTATSPARKEPEVPASQPIQAPPKVQTKPEVRIEPKVEPKVEAKTPSVPIPNHTRDQTLKAIDHLLFQEDLTSDDALSYMNTMNVEQNRPEFESFDDMTDNQLDMFHKWIGKHTVMEKIKKHNLISRD